MIFLIRDRGVEILSVSLVHGCSFARRPFTFKRSSRRLIIRQGLAVWHHGVLEMMRLPMMRLPMMRLPMMRFPMMRRGIVWLGYPKEMALFTAQNGNVDGCVPPRELQAEEG